MRYEDKEETTDTKLHQCDMEWYQMIQCMYERSYPGKQENKKGGGGMKENLEEIINL